MFGGFSLAEALRAGGATLWVLLGCSILVVAVAVEKARLFLRLRQEAGPEQRLRQALARKNRAEAREAVEHGRCLLADLLREGLLEGNPGNAESARRGIEEWVEVAQNRTGVLGTIGAVSPFIGLFGTVVGIMRAFADIGRYGSGNPTVVAAGIAEALIATATGLAVAIPSVILYNYFIARFDRLRTQWIRTAEEAAEVLGR